MKTAKQAARRTGKKAVKSKLFTFTIDRAKWGRGALLLNSSGTMCCLGFYQKALGAKLEVGQGYLAGSPGDNMREMIRRKAPWLFDGDVHSNDAGRCAVLNDRWRRGPRQEKAIARIFLKHGVRVIFKGKAKS